MKNIITTSIAVIAILHTCNAIAESQAECRNEIANLYLEELAVYRSTNTCPSGGRLEALRNEICDCYASGKPVASACPAAQKLCCNGVEVTSTKNHVQTVKEYTWDVVANTCSTDTIHRCETGYYGNPTSDSSGCTSCPPWGGLYRDSGHTAMVWGTTPVPGATVNTNCFVPGGKYYDASGELEITGNCMYI